MKQLLVLTFIFISALAVCNWANECELNINSTLYYNLVNRTSGGVITGASIYVDIWDSDYNSITDDGLMTEYNQGTYAYNLTGSETSSLGTYYIQFNSTKGDDTSFKLSSYQIVTTTSNDALQSILTTLSTLINDMWSYATRTLTEGVLISESDKEDIAKKTWNTTIVDDRAITGGAGKWVIDPATGKLKYT